MPPEPAHRLAPSARWLWRLQGGLGTLAALVAGLALAGRLEPPLDALWPLLPVLAAVALCGLVPELRWRRWRYEVRDEELDIRRGTVTVTRRIVPMARVQHVDTTRGLLEQVFGLATVVVHTAGGGTTIPLLEQAEAARVRDRIAVLSRAPDDD
jgi:membrane protein YdbS with pleckstrin-like domain